MSKRLVALACLATLAACSSDDVSGDTATDTTTTTSSASNSVPQEPEVELTLDSITVGGDVATFVPAGWTVAADGTATPPTDSGFGQGTEWLIDDYCDAPCLALSESAWAEEVARSAFDPIISDVALTVVRDETGVGRRVVEVSDGAGVTTIVIARWVDGASQYLRCEVTAQTGEILAAIEFACDNTRAALDGT